MSTFELLLVPLAPAVLIGVLFLSAWIERRVLSPRALILRAARGHTSPDMAERLVAAESERILTHEEP